MAATRRASVPEIRFLFRFAGALSFSFKSFISEIALANSSNLSKFRRGNAWNRLVSESKESF